MREIRIILIINIYSNMVMGLDAENEIIRADRILFTFSF